MMGIIPSSEGKAKKMPYLSGEIRNLIWDNLASLLARKSKDWTYSVDPVTRTFCEVKKNYLYDWSGVNETAWEIFLHPIAKSHPAIFWEFLSRVCGKVVFYCDAPDDLYRLDQNIWKYCNLSGVPTLHMTGHGAMRLKVDIIWDVCPPNVWIEKLQHVSALIKTIQVHDPSPIPLETVGTRDAPRVADQGTFRPDNSGRHRFDVVVLLYDQPWGKVAERDRIMMLDAILDPLLKWITEIES